MNSGFAATILFVDDLGRLHSRIVSTTCRFAAEVKRRDLEREYSTSFVSSGIQEPDGEIVAERPGPRIGII